MPNERKIILDGNINFKTAGRIFKELFKLQQISANPILFEITESAGGDVILSIMLYQLLRHSIAECTTVVRKKAHSGAFFIFQGGRVRRMCKSAVITFHWAELKTDKGFVMDFESIGDLLSYIEKCNEQLYGIIIESSGMNLGKIIEFCQEEKCLTAKEAIKLNLADQIIDDY